MSSHTPSYHLWVKPTGAAYALVARTIRDLADELGTPSFEPHVTLLGSLDGTEREHRQRTETLCRLLRPVPFVLTEPGYLDEYFRCVFMLVDQTQEVRWYRASALHAFDRPDEPFMPHVSLVYGSLTESRKQEIVARLPPELRTTFLATSLALVRADSPAPHDWHEILDTRVGG
jgi:2'-5' RNA ligase